MSGAIRMKDRHEVMRPYSLILIFWQHISLFHCVHLVLCIPFTSTLCLRHGLSLLPFSVSHTAYYNIIIIVHSSASRKLLKANNQLSYERLLPPRPTGTFCPTTDVLSRSSISYKTYPRNWLNKASAIKRFIPRFIVSAVEYNRSDLAECGTYTAYRTKKTHHCLPIYYLHAHLNVCLK